MKITNLILLVLLIILLLVTSCTYVQPFIGDNNANNANGYNCYICLTTLPERLEHDWFCENLKYTIDLIRNTHMKIILYVPYRTIKNVEYKIPSNVENLVSNLFQIVRVPEDLGPLTKYSTLLQDDSINEDATIIIIDDDIRYKNFFKLLYKSVLNDSSRIHVMCYANVHGFKGIGFKKKLMKNLKYLKRDPSCFKIDDNVLEYFVKKNNIKLKVVPFENDTGWFCTMNNETNTHPAWTELRENESGRPELTEKCYKKLDELNIIGL